VPKCGGNIPFAFGPIDELEKWQKLTINSFTVKLGINKNYVYLNN
jgi:hypothetical protein